MKEDILGRNYRDPFELDESAYDRIDGYGDMVADLGQQLNEDLNKLHRKRKESQYEVNEVTGEIHRKVRPVNASKPWDDDQSLIWPEAEAEAFEQALEMFRQRPVSNTGYINKALNKLMKQRWGKQADDCIKDKRFKESARKRFVKKLTEQVGAKKAKELKLDELLED